MVECPKCGAKIVRQCRCLRSDITCAEGHVFHRCSVHKVWVPGHSDHSLPGNQCTCGQGDRMFSDKDIKQCIQPTTPTLFEFTEGKTIAGMEIHRMIAYIKFTDNTGISIAWLENSALNAMGIDKDGIVIQLT